MIIDDLDQLGAAVAPDKAKAPLIVDPDAMLAATIAGERFKPVARRRAKVGKPGCRVEHVELAQRHRLDGLKRGHRFAPKERRRALAFERPDHPNQI